MVMSIEEEITGLEEQLKNTKGPGSKAKKKAIQAKIDEKKAGIGGDQNDTPLDDTLPEDTLPEEESKPDPLTPSEGIAAVSSANCAAGFHWVRGSDKDAEKYAKEGVLGAHDPSLRRCMIRDK